jgi:hypothetical protein
MAPLNIGQIGGILRNLGGQATKFLDKDLMAGAIRAGVSPRAVVRAEGSIKDLGKAAVNMRSIQVPTALATLGVVNDQSFTNDIQNTLNQVGPAIDRTVSNIIPSSIRNPLNQFASDQEKKGFGGALEVATPFGFLTSSLIPNTPGAQAQQLSGAQLPPETGGRAYGTRATLNGKPVVWAGKDYGWQSPKTGSATMDALNAPGVQDRFIQDKRRVPPGGPPQERARLEEASRIAQQTAQNPLFQKYQVAELTKQYNTAANPAEKERIGLQIWAQTNPGLAAKLKSGQVGYTESRTAPGISNAGGLLSGGLPMPQTGFNVAATMPNLGTPEQIYKTPVAGFDAAATTPMIYNPSALQSPLTDSAIQASYGQQLQATPDFAKALRDKAFLQRAYREQGLK